MAVETLSAFPSTIVSGDTIRIAHSNSDFPATAWTLKVSLIGETVTQTVDATANGAAYSIVITPAISGALIPPGLFTVRFTYTATSGGDRATSAEVYYVTVLADPTATAEASIARQILSAMEAAALILASEPDATANFNGQTFTSKSLPEFQRAIEHQKAVVAIEEGRRTGRNSVRRILYRT